MLTWGMQDANIDAKEAAKKVDVFIKVRLRFVSVCLSVGMVLVSHLLLFLYQYM